MSGIPERVARAIEHEALSLGRACTPLGWSEAPDDVLAVVYTVEPGPIRNEGRALHQTRVVLLCGDTSLASLITSTEWRPATDIEREGR